MRTISAPLLAAMTERRGGATHLLKIGGGAVDLFWTDAPFPVIFGGDTYVQQWFSKGDTVIDNDGNQAVELVLPDVGRIIRGLLYDEDWSYRPATLYECWFDASTKGQSPRPPIDAYIEADGRADAGRINLEETTEPVTIAVVPDSDAEGAPGPAQAFESSCRYVNATVGVGFSTIQCGYAGATTTCDGTFARCTVLANQTRFGGARFAPKAGSTVSVGMGQVPVGSR